MTSELRKSREAKLKEWQSNVFSLQDRAEVPLFNRKKRSSSSSAEHYLPGDQVINLLINTSKPAPPTVHEQRTTQSQGVRDLLIQSSCGGFESRNSHSQQRARSSESDIFNQKPLSARPSSQSPCRRPLDSLSMKQIL